jgi:hypothetical protein
MDARMTEESQRFDHPGLGGERRTQASASTAATQSSPASDSIAPQQIAPCTPLTLLLPQTQDLRLRIHILLCPRRSSLMGRTRLVTVGSSKT